MRYCHKRRPISGFRHVRHFYDNASSQTSELWVREGYHLVAHHTLQIQPHACSFLFPKQILCSGHRYKSRQAYDSAIRQCLRGLHKSAYLDAFKNWIQRLKFCISKNGEDFEEILSSFHFLNRMILRYRTIHIAYRSVLVYE